ncbi:MAG: metallopeptidase family protein [Candidatus Bipolaricaulota bacterium]|nr:metallopeptidase family protein [Candidatus Bipolaricaulota bacterium]
MPIRVGEERFAELVREALAELPPEFQRYLQGLEVRVEDYPSDELMREWGLKPPDYPFGMYEGPSLLEADDPRDFPGTIVLFRRPLEEWCGSEEELRDQIRRTVFHELAHRFGFPEEGMPEEVRAGAGFPWPEAERLAEAQRFWEQARHDLGAAQVLQAAGFPDWALETALTAAYRGLVAFLLRKGEDPEIVLAEGIPALLVRAAKHQRGLGRFRGLARLDQVSTDMGAPGVEPPRRRVREKEAAAAVRLAAELLKALGGGEDGAV